ncbi:MAG: response regulator, partial [Flavobacteriaceae bacterium]|nr:response regulator [Flavobacteriaceae bacterium]
MQKKLRIGIIEDEVLIAENITMHLEDMGHVIVGVAGSFDDAISQIKRVTPDLLLVDIRLRGERSGIKIAKELSENYKIPFLFLTSNTDRATIKQAMECFPLAYIRKPFSFEDLFI